MLATPVMSRLETSATSQLPTIELERGHGAHKFSPAIQKQLGDLAKGESDAPIPHETPAPPTPRTRHDAQRADSSNGHPPRVHAPHTLPVAAQRAPPVAVPPSSLSNSRRSRVSNLQPSALPVRGSALASNALPRSQRPTTLDVEQGSGDVPPPTGPPPPVTTVGAGQDGRRPRRVQAGAKIKFIRAVLKVRACIQWLAAELILVIVVPAFAALSAAFGALTIVVGQQVMLVEHGGAWVVPGASAARIGAVGGAILSPLIFCLLLVTYRYRLWCFCGHRRDWRCCTAARSGTRGHPVIRRSSCRRGTNWVGPRILLWSRMCLCSCRPFLLHLREDSDTSGVISQRSSFLKSFVPSFPNICACFWS